MEAKSQPAYQKCTRCGYSIAPGANSIGRRPDQICRNCYNALELDLVKPAAEDRKKLQFFEAPDLVDPQLWLGGCFADISKPYLDLKGIRAILLVCSEGIERWKESIVYEKIPVEDNFQADLRGHFKKAIEFISGQIAKGNGVLVRCAAGVSRSATVVIAYIMQTKHWGVDRALKYVKEVRPFVEPNYKFMAQLRDFEAEVL